MLRRHYILIRGQTRSIRSNIYARLIRVISPPFLELPHAQVSDVQNYSCSSWPFHLSYHHYSQLLAFTTTSHTTSYTSSHSLYAPRSHPIKFWGLRSGPRLLLNLTLSFAAEVVVTAGSKGKEQFRRPLRLSREYAMASPMSNPSHRASLSVSSGSAS
jgi:hypothetical protein